MNDPTEPMRVWKDAFYVFDSFVMNSGGFLFDEGCVYIYYKQIIDSPSIEPYTISVGTGEYRIIIVN